MGDEFGHGAEARTQLIAFEHPQICRCIAAAAREAVPLGYEVIVASDAVATRPINAFDGKGVVSAQDLNRAALTEISDAFAAVEPTGEILNLPVH